MTTTFLPGATIGVFGSGQLGRMMALAARRLGYRIHVYSPDLDAPAGAVADLRIQADYEDLDQVSRFAQNVDVITFEFENIPLIAAQTAERFVPVRPNGTVLHTTQNRIREKNFLRAQGIPVAPFIVLESLEDLQRALVTLGTPAIIKTADWGYDGKGQMKITSPAQAQEVWKSFQGRSAVVEGFVNFECEASVIVARGVDGQIVTYGPIRNVHRNHILDVSLYPGGFRRAVASQAIEMARTIAERLDYVGVMCVEFFVDVTGNVLVNEIAPRPHNSGHLTIEACSTSQFEQQVRAVCGLPLGSPKRIQSAAMVNLLGDVWDAGTPEWKSVLKRSDTYLHLYGKAEARRGRKMGHVTVCSTTARKAARIARKIRRTLCNNPVRKSEISPAG